MSRDQRARGGDQGHGQASGQAAGAAGGDAIAQGHMAVQLLEGGSLFPRISAWAAHAIETGNFAGAREASMRWNINRPHLRTLAQSLDPTDHFVARAQALLDDMAPLEAQLPDILEMGFTPDSPKGRARWLARLGREEKTKEAPAEEVASPPVHSPLRPENVKSDGLDLGDLAAGALGAGAVLWAEQNRHSINPVEREPANIITKLTENPAYTSGFVVGGIEGAWAAVKDNAHFIVELGEFFIDMVKAQIAGGDIGVLMALRDKIMDMIAAGRQVPAALKAFAERWNDASHPYAQGHFQGHAVGYIAVQVLVLVLGAVTPGGQYADVIRVLKLATDPISGLAELGAAAKATRAAKAAGKAGGQIEHAIEGGVAGERAGVKAAEGGVAGERRLGGVFEDAGAPGRGEVADGPRSPAAHRPGPDGAVEPIEQRGALPGIARPLSRAESLLEGLPGDLRGRVRIVESPVLTDSTVRVAYHDGIEIIVGAEATPRHIAYHTDTVRALLRYEGITGEIRKLIDKVLSMLHVRAGYGTRGFEADLEVKKLTGIRDDLQRLLTKTDGRLHGGEALDPAVLRGELESVEAQLAHHREALGSHEGGVGFVAARGLPETRVARSDLFVDILEDQRAFLLEFKVTTPNGEVRRWGTATIPLDESGAPLSGPFLELDATVYVGDEVTRMKITDGDTTLSATEYALERAENFYKRRFGSAPPALAGDLAAENKLNFQREWYRLVSSGTPPAEAAEHAVARISFGTHRAARGYGKFDVTIAGDIEAVDLGPPFGVQMVPTGIKVTATKPGAPR